MAEIVFDQNGIKLDGFEPRGVALATTVQALTSSYYIVLDSDTTLLRVYAIAKDIYLKWAEDGEDYASSTNFDEIIVAGTTLNLGVPVKTDGTYYTAIQVVGREAGSTVVVIEK